MIASLIREVVPFIGDTFHSFKVVARVRFPLWAEHYSPRNS
jgi:hypothetical protein